MNQQELEKILLESPEVDLLLLRVAEELTGEDGKVRKELTREEEERLERAVAEANTYALKVMQANQEMRGLMHSTRDPWDPWG